MIELQSVWGWQPALYLFLGGMGAGAFVVAAVLYLRCGSKAGKTVAVSAWCSIVCLAVGLLCLLTELTNPLRGLLLWQSFSNFSSWMTIGAWVLVAALVVFGVFAVLSTEKTAALVSQAWKGLYAKRHRVLSVLAIVGIVLGIGVAAYTGILLMSAPGVPLWNTPLLPFLFTVSGLDTGIALVEVVSVANAKKEALPSRGHRLMETARRGFGGGRGDRAGRSADEHARGRAAGRWRGKWLGDGRAVCGLVDDGLPCALVLGARGGVWFGHAAFGGSDRLDFASGETPGESCRAGRRTFRQGPGGARRASRARVRGFLRFCEGLQLRCRPARPRVEARRGQRRRHGACWRVRCLGWRVCAEVRRGLGGRPCRPGCGRDGSAVCEYAGKVVVGRGRCGRICWAGCRRARLSQVGLLGRLLRHGAAAGGVRWTGCRGTWPGFAEVVSKKNGYASRVEAYVVLRPLPTRRNRRWALLRQSPRLACPVKIA